MIFELRITVAYDLQDTSEKEIETLLYLAAQHLANEGMLSGSTDAEVDSWDSSVTKISEEAA